MNWLNKRPTIALFVWISCILAGLIVWTQTQTAVRQTRQKKKQDLYIPIGSMNGIVTYLSDLYSEIQINQNVYQETEGEISGTPRQDPETPIARTNGVHNGLFHRWKEFLRVTLILILKVKLVRVFIFNCNGEFDNCNLIFVFFLWGEIERNGIPNLDCSTQIF